jgi:quinol monooxygenase YgiN
MIEDQSERSSIPAMSELHGIARFKIHEGKLEEFKRLSAECMEIVRAKDTGTLQYDIYFNDDQSEAFVHEEVQGLRGAHRAHRAPWRNRGGNPRDGIGVRRTTW